MQSLTTPASISKRKQACRSCRHRKKRCDGERPSCALCRKWGIQCEYTVTAVDRSRNAFPTPRYTSTLLGLQPSFGQDDPYLVQFPGLEMASQFNILPSLELPPVDDFNLFTPPTGPAAVQSEGMVDSGSGITADAGLPSDAVLTELVILFFENYYHVFPCFHKATFLQQIQSRSVQSDAPSLLYSMCAIAAPHHPDQSVRDQHMHWHELAKFEYEMAGQDARPPVRIIQTALLTLRHASNIGDYSSGWLFIGKAWRQACALGLNRVDSDDEGFYGISYPRPKTPVEKEEYRRTLWLLFMTDRALSWPTGWPQAIDERQFKVNFPVAEGVFQAMTTETGLANSRPIPFVRNPNSLLSTTSMAANPLNMFHHLIIVHVLLGRVTEQIHSLHEAPDSPEYAQQCNDLDAYLVKFRLSLPRVATSVLEASPEDRGHVLWLNVTINTMAILLHYRCARLVDQSVSHEQFTRAVAAARNIAQIVKDTSLISIDLLLSAHVASSLYIAACVLVIQWKSGGSESLKADIDLFCLVFERFREKYATLGHKFRSALDYDLTRSAESISDLRERGFRGLLADCSKWRAVMGQKLDRDLGY